MAVNNNITDTTPATIAVTPEMLPVMKRIANATKGNVRNTRSKLPTLRVVKRFIKDIEMLLIEKSRGG
jgi:hypothetical protein